MEYPEKRLITWVDDNGEYVGLCEYIRADLVPQWQPIETAPKTHPILALMTDGGVDIVWWNVDFLDGTEYWQNDADDEPDPTHWMPLPAPPSE